MASLGAGELANLLWQVSALEIHGEAAITLLIVSLYVPCSELKPQMLGNAGRILRTLFLQERRTHTGLAEWAKKTAVAIIEAFQTMLLVSGEFVKMLVTMRATWAKLWRSVNTQKFEGAKKELFALQIALKNSLTTHDSQAWPPSPPSMQSMRPPQRATGILQYIHCLFVSKAS